VSLRGKIRVGEWCCEVQQVAKCSFLLPLNLHVCVYVDQVVCDTDKLLMKCAPLWYIRVDWYAYTVYFTALELSDVCSMYAHTSLFTL